MIIYQLAHPEARQNFTPSHTTTTTTTTTNTIGSLA